MQNLVNASTTGIESYTFPLHTEGGNLTMKSTIIVSNASTGRSIYGLEFSHRVCVLVVCIARGHWSSPRMGLLPLAMDIRERGPNCPC